MSKLFYKLGLEELAEIAPVAEVPTVSEQEVELDVNRIGSDVLSDVAQVDVAEADTTTLEEVKTALESALKGVCDHSSLVFAKRTLQMVDKRWGFDYPVASMEDSTETLIASMEDGVGQRLKDLGKAMLEMLKKIWAKLKEWGGKLLELLGFRKKKLQEIKKEAILIKEERWEEVGGYSHHVKQYSDGAETRLVSKTITREDYVAPVPVMAGTHHEDKPAAWRGKAVSATPVQPEQHRDKTSESGETKQAKREIAKANMLKHREAVKFEPHLDPETFSLLCNINGTFPVGAAAFNHQLEALQVFADVGSIMNDIVEDVLDVLKHVQVVDKGVVDKCRVEMGNVYHDAFRYSFVKSDLEFVYYRVGYIGGGGYTAFIHDFARNGNVSHITSIEFDRTKDAAEETKELVGKLVYSNIALFPSDVVTVSQRLANAVDDITIRMLKQQEVFEKQSKELLSVIQTKQLGKEWEHPAIWTKNLLTAYGSKFAAAQQGYKAYLGAYSAALTRHLELSNDYQKHLHLVEMSGK